MSEEIIRILEDRVTQLRAERDELKRANPPDAKLMEYYEANEACLASITLGSSIRDIEVIQNRFHAARRAMHTFKCR